MTSREIGEVSKIRKLLRRHPKVVYCYLTGLGGESADLNPIRGALTGVELARVEFRGV